MPGNFLSARWENLIMANYAVPPAILGRYLPKGVEIDTFDQKAYVSLVGFMFRQTSLFNIPIPFIGTFEEINLRFYVRRVEGDIIKRGVVFISEAVPYKLVAWLANKLYYEHYIAVPTKNVTLNRGSTREVNYQWKINHRWNHLGVTAMKESVPMLAGSIEEFIFEHYYGYTKVSGHATQEYQVKHPRWQVNKVRDYSIDCDFRSVYGDDFAFLNQQNPDSVFMAEGSGVVIKWKRDLALNERPAALSNV